MTEPEKKYLVIVKGDTNDADYEHRLEWIDDKGTLVEQFGPLIQALKDFKAKKKAFKDALNDYRRIHSEERKTSPEAKWNPQNLPENPGHYMWGPRDNTIEEKYPDLEPEMIEAFEEWFAPWGDYEYGIHTIEYIKILEVTDVKDIL